MFYNVFIYKYIRNFKFIDIADICATELRIQEFELSLFRCWRNYENERRRLSIAQYYCYKHIEIKQKLKQNIKT